MLKRTLPLILTLAITLATASCIFDPSEPPACKDCVTETRVYLDRTEKWHVLNNVELSYNLRNIDRYDALLDDAFTFFLSTGDVGGGLPESWGRADEVTANRNLFSKKQPDNGPLCRSIKMNIQWETDDKSLKPQPKTDLFTIELPGSGPNGDETWYTTTVYYDFQIDVDPDLTYLNNPGSRAQFTVRNDGTVDAPKWTLVEFRDLGSD